MKSCTFDRYHVFFRNLANPVKISILSKLKESESSVNDLSNNLGIEQSKVSHALASLSNCNIVQSKQDGKRRIYFLNKKTILPMLKLVDKHKCGFCGK
jgi:DNA-binding transcriptional ArsR family regulator